MSLLNKNSFDDDPSCAVKPRSHPASLSSMRESPGTTPSLLSVTIAAVRMKRKASCIALESSAKELEESSTPLKIEHKLLELLACPPGSDKISVGKFLTSIQEAGLQFDDPRLKESVFKLHTALSRVRNRSHPRTTTGANEDEECDDGSGDMCTALLLSQQRARHQTVDRLDQSHRAESVTSEKDEVMDLEPCSGERRFSADSSLVIASAHLPANFDLTPEIVDEITDIGAVLDKEVFRACIQDSMVFIGNAFTNKLAVKNFTAFRKSLTKIFDQVSREETGLGSDVCRAIPVLANVNPDKWGVAVCTADGQRFGLGDFQESFSLQHMCCPLLYALCLSQKGTGGSDAAIPVHEYVGTEPSGKSYNSIKCLNSRRKPHNPFTSSGAMVICSLLAQSISNLSDAFDDINNRFRAMAGGLNLGFSPVTYLSERELSDRNSAIAHYLQENNCFPVGTSMRNNLELYLQICSVQADCATLSVMAATLANGGICPISGEKVISAESARDTLSMMGSCGMGAYSGQFAFQIGLPAKEGFSGGVMVIVPNLMGIVCWSPVLDATNGISAKSLSFCKKFAQIFPVHKYHNHTTPTTSKEDGTSNICDDLFERCGPSRPAEYQLHCHFTIVSPSPENIGAMDNLGVSPKEPLKISVLFAAAQGKIEVLFRYALYGYNPNEVIDYDMRSPLHLAAAEGHLAIVRFLVDRCKAQLDPIDRFGFTPLEEADRFGAIKVAKFLRKRITEYREKQEREIASKAIAIWRERWRDRRPSLHLMAEDIEEESALSMRRASVGSTLNRKETPAVRISIGSPGSSYCSRQLSQNAQNSRDLVYGTFEEAFRRQSSLTSVKASRNDDEHDENEVFMV